MLLVVSKVVAAVILSQPALKRQDAALRRCPHTPLLINVVEPLGADGVVRLKAGNSPGPSEVDDVVAAARLMASTLAAPFADREVEIVLATAGSPSRHQQQCPTRRKHIFLKEGVIRVVGRLVLWSDELERGRKKPSEWSYSEVSAPLPKQRTGRRCRVLVALTPLRSKSSLLRRSRWS